MKEMLEYLLEKPIITEDAPDYIEEWLSQSHSWTDYTESNLRNWIDDLRSLAKCIFTNLYWKETLKYIAKIDIAVRSLKIDSNYYQSRRYAPSRNYTTSKLILKGNWLRDKGFITGRRVNVIALNGLIVIIPENAGKVTADFIPDAKKRSKRWGI